MRPLPPAVSSVVSPTMWSPSQLAQGLECRLRTLFKASSSYPNLITHPRAALGSVTHRLLENATRGRIERSHDLRAAVEAEFYRLLSVEEATLSSSEETAHFGALSNTFTEVQWLNYVREHVSAATSLLEHAPLFRKTKPMARHIGRSFVDLIGPGRWPEVRIQSETLRLTGKMDLIEILPNETVVIRDHKGGKVLDKAGEVIPSIQLQLRLYGLAVLSHRPDSKVELSVSTGKREYRVEFDRHHIEQTNMWLDGFLSCLPANVEQSSESQSNPGSACGLCPHRHVCPTYLELAPQFWRDGLPDGRQALDAWGVITKITSKENLTSLDIQAASSQRVRIQRLDTTRHLLGNARLGQRIWLFGLAASRKRVIRGRHMQPRNFFEIPSNPSDRRAWSLCVYGEG
ncbi:MAG: hypothetical protein COA78_12600 [Blastopirellula sp.]|nr:MAG: hypothetical protein COA78_12600 [Blastopirellula sp.]